MKMQKPLFVTVSFLLVLLACDKDKSLEGAKQIYTDTLPADYPYATGFCNGESLGITIADTVDYLPDTTGLLPVSFALDMPVPGNQESQGSCTAWAVVYGAGSYYMHTATGKAYSDTGNLSPKFTYNQITKGNCTCTSFLDNLYLLKTEGACSLDAMPYDDRECSFQPDSLQRVEAQPYKINGWMKVNLHNLSMIKKAVTENHPVLFSLNADEGFANIASPYIWKERKGAELGPHALVLVGYDDAKHVFRLMNSWSTAWGDGGFAWIDYDFFFRNVFEGGYIII